MRAGHFEVIEEISLLFIDLCYFTFFTVVCGSDIIDSLSLSYEFDRCDFDRYPK